MIQTNQGPHRDHTEVIEFWKSFFPEITDFNELRKIIKCFLDMDIEEAAQYREEENENIRRQINKTYFSLDYDCQVMKEINDEIQKEIQWTYFFEPIIAGYFQKYYELVLSAPFIADHLTFLKGVFINLYKKLVNISYRTIVMETNIASEEGMLAGENGEEKGRYYCSVLLRKSGYLKEIYGIYPELVRLLDNCTSNTLKYYEKIISDIYTLNVKENNVFGQLLDIQMGQGDTHNGGKSVAKLVFQNKTVYYKPRTLKMEAKYIELLKWLGHKNPNYKEIKYCRMWELDSYGLMEKIENEECSTQEEIQMFYYRMGELLCILYTLNAKDFHCENIIAEGSSPVLIDLETLLHASMDEKNEDNIIFYINEKIQESVIGTSLLPTLLPNMNTEEVIEVGGIGKGEKQYSPFKTQVLRNAGSDDIRIEYVQKELPFALNYPRFKGKVIGCSDYLNDVRAGFSDLYVWIYNNKSSYMKEIKKLFAQTECRVIIKNTNIYTQLLETGCHPDILHNLWDRKIYFCRLGLLLIQNKEYERLTLYRSEYNELLESDIPIFCIKTDARIVFNMRGEKILELNKKNTVLEMIEKKINSLGENDFQRQVALINHSYIGSKMQTDIPVETGIKFAETSMQKETSVPGMIYAEKIADLCAERGITNWINGEKEIMWIGMRGFGKEFYRITPIGLALYQGNSGIALFYFLLYSKTTDFQYKNIADQSFLPVLRHISQGEGSGEDIEGIGAFTGLASEIYTALFLYKNKLAGYLGKDTINFIIGKNILYLKKRIGLETNVDLLSGLAGILGVFVTAYKIAGSGVRNEVFDFIQNIADIILSKMIPQENNTVTWCENGDIGYAHGNAGIIVQLARFYSITQDEGVKAVIDKALEYERREHYDSEKNIWLFRKDTHYYSWCNGIAGLLLEKIILLQCGWEDELLKSEINIIVEQLGKTGFGSNASICHGDMGSLELLRYASCFLENSQLYSRCENTKSDFIQNFLEKNWEALKYLEDWGMMTGLTGIGLSLTADSNELTDILCLM